MSKVYKFYYNGEDGVGKEVVKLVGTDDGELTLGELRGMFYDWLACLGYPVQEFSNDE